MVPKTYAFCFRRGMRYAVQFPAHRLGGRIELCVILGLCVCVKRGSTVFFVMLVLPLALEQRHTYIILEEKITEIWTIDKGNYLKICRSMIIDKIKSSYIYP